MPFNTFESFLPIFFHVNSVWLYFLLLIFDSPPGFLTPFLFFAFWSPVCKLLAYWQLSLLLLSTLTFLFNSVFSPFLSPVLTFLLTSSSLRLLPHLLSSISSIQLYDLGSPADSQSSSPGCLTTDSSCVNMGYPSCGHRGRCHGEWGSFSCQCVPGYTGHQCEEGKPNLFWTIALTPNLCYFLPLTTKSSICPWKMICFMAKCL